MDEAWRDERFQAIRDELCSQEAHALLERLEYEHAVWEKASLTAILEERNDLRERIGELEAELARCREGLAECQIRLGTKQAEEYLVLRKQLEGLQGALNESHRELAAAEARLNFVGNILRNVPELSGYDDMWWLNGVATMQQISDFVSEAIVATEEAEYPALGAALEQREREALSFAISVAEKHAEGYEEHHLRYHSQGKYTKARMAMECRNAATMIANDIEGGY
jgi:hypothetical protein